MTDSAQKKLTAQIADLIYKHLISTTDTERTDALRLAVAAGRKAVEVLEQGVMVSVK